MHRSVPFLTATLLVASASAAAPESLALDPQPKGGAWSDYTPDFNADGSRILFTSNRGGDEDQLFTVDVATGAIEQLTRGPGAHRYGSYSPDGRRIALVSTRSGDAELWIMNSDGSNAMQLTSGGFEGFYERPDWSPDGRRIAFDWSASGTHDIWTIDATNGALEQVTDDEPVDAYPSWSPDGRRLVFWTRGRHPSTELYLVNVDGSGLRRLTTLPELAWAPHWSDDGARIVFWAGEVWDYQIYTIAPDGSGLTRLTDSWEWNWSPRWSRDGEWITFSSSRTGLRGVYVMRRDGSDVRQLTNSGSSHFARVVLEEGVDAGLTRLAYSRQAHPQAHFTSATELRVLIRTLRARDELDQARRLADASLLEQPDSTDAADLRSEVRRAQGEEAPPTARELVRLHRHGAYAEARRRISAAEGRFPGWRPYSPSWLRVLTRELRLLGNFEELARLDEDAQRWYPNAAHLHSELALASAADASAAARDGGLLEPVPFGREIYDYAPDLSADGKTILFSSNRAEGAEQLFTFELATGEISQLTQGSARNHLGSYSPDGSQIAFVSTRTGGDELWVMRRDGSDPHRLTEGGHGISERPDWSPDGRFLAFDWEREGRPKIWTIEVATGTLRQVTDGPGLDSYPSWSPDGRELVFMARGRRPSIDLWIVGVDGSGLRRLTDLPNMTWAPHWSDDGARIAFWSGEPWDDQVYTVAPDGRDLRRLTEAREYNWSPRWSRDGAWIVFRSSRSGQAGAIWIMHSDGSEARPLTELGASDFARAVRRQGVDHALSRLAESRHSDPEATFTTPTECRVLIRELLARGELVAAQRLADWNLLERPRSSDAGDIWIDVRHARGLPAPIAARELESLVRRGAYDEARARYSVSRASYPAWRPLSAQRFLWLLEELEELGAYSEMRWLAEEALEFDPTRAGLHVLHAAALRGLGLNELARTALERALALDPDDARARRLLQDH